jgi:hypothetical protein
MRTFSDTTFAEQHASGVHRSGGDLRPRIQPKHIDGPMLCFSDGQLHWLTLRERLLYAIGWTDAYKLQQKLRPRLTAELSRDPR